MNLDDIEQKAPNGPNFKLIVGLFCATLLVFFVLALLFLRVDGGRIHFINHPKNPNASLHLPAFGPATYCESLT